MNPSDNQRCLQHSLCHVVAGRVDREAASHLLSLMQQETGYADLTGIPDATQIKLLNQFWRKFVNQYPNTTEVRTWLENHDGYDEYVRTFSERWLHLVVKAACKPKTSTLN